MGGTLYVVATPIGNLEDITLRALRILKEADLIAAEDTRRTAKLLAHYGIRKPLTSYHEHNESAKARLLIEKLKSGTSVALVCDAGTPLISDPGWRLLQEALEAKIPVVPIPGPSALAAVLSVCGLPTETVIFEGFLPARQRERQQRLQKLKQETRTLVFYEAPHRIRASLRNLREALGDRQAVIAREVTKIHEEFLRGTLSQLVVESERRELKGEITIVVAGAVEPTTDRAALVSEVEKMAARGMGAKEIAGLLGEKFSLPKREVYRLAAQAKGGNEWKGGSI